MLQALASQGGSARGTTHEEPARLHVARRPGQIADPLEAEHGVVDVEGDHADPMIAVGRACGHPRRNGAGFADAFLEDLSLAVLAIVQQLIGVLRPVQLPLARVDAELAEQAFHSEGAGFVGDNGNDMLAHLLVPRQCGQHPHERHCGGDLAVAGALQLSVEHADIGDLQRVGVSAANRERTTQGFPALEKILDLRTVIGGPVVGRLADLVVGNGNLETVAKSAKRLLAHFLLLVGDVLALAGLAHAITLDGHGEDQGRPTGMLGGRVVGRIDLLSVVTATMEPPDVIVAHVGDHVLQLRILAEEILAGIRTAVPFERLIFAVDAFLHALAQEPLGIAHEQRVPIRPPQHLDHIPAGAAEIALQFLHHTTVAANRAVETLQVAVDDENQVIELFACRQRNGALRFRLVHLAVAHERPDLAIGRIDEAALVHVFHEPRLIDRRQRPEPH